jgi:Ca2+-binding RTX toxin-like protein
VALYDFQTITAAQALGYNGTTDSLSFGAGSANSASVAFLSAPEQVAISFNGQTVNFGTGIYGDLDLSFANGGRLYVGSTAADNASGTPADDGLFGGAGGDSLSGGDGADLLQGNQGADSLVGGAGNDTIYGGQDNDVIVLGTATGESNFANGNKGDDTITGSSGTDTILGGQGADVINGGSGGSLLDGNLGDDTIHGGAGADMIIGEGGYDIMSGGGGADLFIFAPGSSVLDFALADRILDWSSTDHLSVSVTGGYTEITPPPSNAPPSTTPPIDPYAAPAMGNPSGYSYAPLENAGASATQDEYSVALSAASNALSSNAALKIVAVQAGADVGVFVDTNGDHVVDLSIVLVGQSLNAIDSTNFI